jgi:hypothetical protein
MTTFGAGGAKLDHLIVVAANSELPGRYILAAGESSGARVVKSIPVTGVLENKL